MAGDTREENSINPPEAVQPAQNEESTRSQRNKPKHDFPQTQAGKLWEAFGNQDEQVNKFAGASSNATGGKQQQYTWKDTLSFSKEDFSRFYQTGCARDSLLVGIAGGGAVGGVKFIWGGVRQLMTAANWSVGTFTLASLSVYTWCEYRRRQEAIGMTQAVAGMKMLQDKKKQEEQAAKEAKEKAEAAARQAEEERRRKSWTSLSNYKFW